MNYAGHTPEDVGSATHLCLRIHIAGKPRHETRDSNDSFKAECPSLRIFRRVGREAVCSGGVRHRSGVVNFEQTGVLWLRRLAEGEPRYELRIMRIGQSIRICR